VGSTEMQMQIINLQLRRYSTRNRRTTRRLHLTSFHELYLLEDWVRM